mmetsp:Transcript_1942/g.4625  ORF Transcript_1942/g.4625 Transcript_1942/m.4625 type:complete len:161 (-) Transcript_1942:10-492(-)
MLKATHWPATVEAKNASMSMCGWLCFAEGFRLRPTTFQRGECFEGSTVFKPVWSGTTGQNADGAPTSSPKSPTGLSEGRNASMRSACDLSWPRKAEVPAVCLLGAAALAGVDRTAKANSTGKDLWLAVNIHRGEIDPCVLCSQWANGREHFGVLVSDEVA